MQLDGHDIFIYLINQNSSIHTTSNLPSPLRGPFLLPTLLAPRKLLVF